MKAEYIKFSDERNKVFSIATRFEEIHGQLKVIKNAIYPEGQKHLENMLRYADVLRKVFPDVVICPVELIGTELYFDFISGESLTDCYLRCIQQKDRESFIKLLHFHKKIILGSAENRCTFVESEQSRTWFGNLKAYEGKEGLRISNFDAIASNIIMNEEKPAFIDYEWVFEQPIPVDIVLYHCIRDAYLHDERMNAFFPLEDAMIEVGVIDRQDIMEGAYCRFFEHVISDDCGRSFALDKRLCLKQIKNTSDLLEVNQALEELKRENQTLQNNLSESRREWDKCAQYWKESVEANHQIHTDYRQEMEELKQKETEYKQDMAEHKKIIADKDRHIENIEEQLREVRGVYDNVANTFTWRAIRKLKSILKR